MNLQLKYGIYLSYIALFLTNIINIILTPFLIDNLGSSEYGIYILIGSLIAYLSIFDFGMSNTTIRYIAKYKAENKFKEERKFIFHTILIYGILSLITALMSLIIYINLEAIFGMKFSVDELNILKIMFIFLVINVFLTFPMNFFKGIITGYEQFVFVKIVSLIRLLVRTVLIVSLILYGNGAIAIVAIDTLLNILTVIIYFYYINKKLKLRLFNKVNVDFSYIKNLFSYSYYIFVGMIVDLLYWRIGLIILGVFSGAHEIAIFSIALLICNYTITLGNALTSVFLPKITKLTLKSQNIDKIGDIFIKIGRIQLIILSFILLIFLIHGQNLLVLWLGKEFIDTWKYLIVMLIPLTFVLTQSLGISILQALNLYKFRAYSYLIVSVFALALGIYAYNQIGTMGIALATSFSLIIGNLVIMNIYFYKKVKLDIKKFILKVFWEIGGKIALSFLLIFLVNKSINFEVLNGWNLSIEIFFSFIIHTFLIFVFILNQFERKAFINELNKIIRR